MVMKITPETLKQRQSMPLGAKVAMTEMRIREWYSHYRGLVYISFSGGKDSTVMLDIAKRLYPDIPSVYCDTGLEYPEARKFALSKADKVLKPNKTFKQVIEDYGYPVPSKEQAQYIREARHGTDKLKAKRLGRGSYSVSDKWRYLIDAPFEVSEECCRVMKKAPFKKYERVSHRHPMIATMAEESSVRRRQYLAHGCNMFDKARACSTPLGFWTQQDVLEYLLETGIDYADCYGDIVRGSDGKLSTTGVNRTGCIFCMFGVEFERYPNRFQKMQTTHPKLYEYCMDKLNLREVLEYCGIPYFDSRACSR
jgi:3'-phosphoadenosine 5'-phosphosulfate sulfotransferase (PAPS reductase)/FAD synthetase